MVEQLIGSGTDRRTLRILCVDDHELGLKTRAILLKMEGYSVLTATTAGEGWRLFADAEVDLVITDYYLPDQLGTELAGKMKALRPNVPIVLLSGSIDAPADLGGADVFLSKAVDPLTFLSFVRDVVGKTTAHDCVLTN
jgi:CheY-like chemotaxis protein